MEFSASSSRRGGAARDGGGVLNSFRFLCGIPAYTHSVCTRFCSGQFKLRISQLIVVRAKSQEPLSPVPHLSRSKAGNLLSGRLRLTVSAELNRNSD